MKTFHDMIFRSPEDGGAPAATPVSPPAAAAAAPEAPPAGEAQPPAGAAAQPGAAPYWPEGLDPQFKGADEKATLDNLAKAVKGYRDRDATRDVPADPAGYFDYAAIADFQVSDSEKPYFDALKDDLAFEAMAKALHKDGVGRGAAMRAFKAGLGAMGESGWLLPLADEKAERAAMLPEAAKSLAPAEQDAAIDRRVNDAVAFLKLAPETMGLPKAGAAYAELMLTDRAAGLEFLEWAKAQAQKGGAQPGAVGEGGKALTHAELRARKADERANPRSTKYDQRFAEETTRLYAEFAARGGKFDD